MAAHELFRDGGERRDWWETQDKETDDGIAVFCQKQFLDPPPAPDWVLHITEASVLQFLVSTLAPGPSRTGLNPRIIAVGALLCFLGRKIRIL